MHLRFLSKSILNWLIAIELRQLGKRNTPSSYKVSAHDKRLVLLESKERSYSTSSAQGRQSRIDAILKEHALFNLP